MPLILFTLNQNNCILTVTMSFKFHILQYLIHDFLFVCIFCLYRCTTFRCRSVNVNRSIKLSTVEKCNLQNCFKTLDLRIYIYTGPCGSCGKELSFHSVRPLGHNSTSKSVKVLIFPLALNATIAGYMTA